MASNTEIYQAVTDKIIQALETGTVPWRRPWSGGGANVPRNAVTNRPYRGGNIFWLGFMGMLAGYQENRWLTFKQAMAAKGTFKGQKGDACRKGTTALLWKPIVKAKVDAFGNPVVVKGKVQHSTFLFLKTYTVFNVEQFDGLKLPEHVVTTTDHTPIEDAERVVDEYIKRSGIPVKFGFGHACYVPSMDMIEVPSREQYKNGEEYYSTLFHEFGHSTGHSTRLKRAGIENLDHFGSDQYSREELVAEMSSAFLCAKVGIENTLDNSAAYLNSWITKLKEDPKLILVAAGQAQRSVDYILDVEVDKAGDDS
jgi:antirestriction protein ArdC